MIDDVLNALGVLNAIDVTAIGGYRAERAPKELQ